jgi:integrase
MRIAREGKRKAIPKKLNFTEAWLTGAACPAGKERGWFYDAKQPGLTFMVTDKGAKSFYYLKKLNGRYIRFRLGGFPELHLDAARKAVAEYAGGVAHGFDPMEKKRADRAQMTMRDFQTYYLETYAKPHKPRSWQDEEKQLNRYLVGWKGRKINTISNLDVEALHARIGRDHGHYAANRLVALLHLMFNKARNFGIKENPAHGIKKFRETSRERWVEPDEMPRLWAAIEKEPEPFNDFFRLALLTGARRSNLQSMRWDEIKLDSKTWTIPGEKAKAGSAIDVPLADEAMTILRDRLKARKDDCPWVFPSRKGKSSEHITEPKMAWARILERAGITDLRIHDLRRTCGSWQAALGASLTVIGKGLGHKNIATTQIYAKLNIDPVRTSMQAAASAMVATAKPDASAAQGVANGK